MHDDASPIAPRTVTRRSLLGTGAAATLLGTESASSSAPTAWAKPGMPGWPTSGDWASLRDRVHGRMELVTMPDLSDPATATQVSNPYFLADHPALTQSSGWVDAWQSTPSVYVVLPRSAEDVAEAVRFGVRHRVRLVVRGGGHSYLGGSNAPDSLLVLTRDMNEIVVYDAFVPRGSKEAGLPAVSVGAGCRWGAVYDTVVTKHGRYVQGGGCTTVGVAGLVQGGGFGSFSKAYGLAAASLLEAEVVTADGKVRTVNAHNDADLFWALKGGGGGTFCIVTRLTLRTHDLPERFGAAFATVEANGDAAFRDLLERFLTHYETKLFNAHWGEQVLIDGDNRLGVKMVFQGLSDDEARSAWSDFEAWVRSDERLKFVKPLQIVSLPARRFWDSEYLETHLPGLVARDGRPGAPRSSWWWSGDGDQAGVMWHGYSSLWLPADLLGGKRLRLLTAALFDASRKWQVALHLNKGLAGADARALEAARETSMNPAVLEAFALAIVAGGGPPSFAGLQRRPDLRQARADAAEIRESTEALRRLVPASGSYLSECDYHLEHWQMASWGRHWLQLDQIKRRYDPEGVFLVHHGVGSERQEKAGAA